MAHVLEPVNVLSGGAASLFYAATGGQRNYALLRKIGQQMAEGNDCWPCWSTWDTSGAANCLGSPERQITELTAGRLILPKFLCVSGSDADDFNNPVDGVFFGSAELAALIVEHNWPLVIRTGNWEEEGIGLVRDEPYATSILPWKADYTGNAFLGELRILKDSTYEPTPLVGATVGDFYRVQIVNASDGNLSTSSDTATFCSVNGIGIKTGDRLCAKTATSGNDGDDWEPHPSALGNTGLCRQYGTPMAPDANWSTFKSWMDNGYMDALYAAVPNPVCVIIQDNNESIVESSTFKDNATSHAPGVGFLDHRFETAYPGLTTRQRLMRYRILWRDTKQAIHAGQRAQMPAAWQAVLKHQFYRTCGDAHSGGFRQTPFQPAGSDTYDEHYGSEYGLDWDTINGGSVQMYGGNPDGSGSTGGYQAASMEIFAQNWVPKMLEWVRERNPAFLGGVSISTSGTYTFTSRGNTYYDPELYAANAKYCIMMGLRIVTHYQGHATALTGQNLTAPQAAELAAVVDQIYTFRDYFDRVDDEIQALYNNATVLERLYWPIEYQPRLPGGDPNEGGTNPTNGPKANRGIFCCLNNSHYDVETTAFSGLVTYTIVRRNNQGQGLVFAWDPSLQKGQTKQTTVDCIDGPLAITVTRGGNFVTYDVAS